MLRVSLLSAILAVSTAGSAPEALIERYITRTSPVEADRGSGSNALQSGISRDEQGVSAPALVAPRSKIVRQASDGLFYVDATVNGERVHFVVDTGASVVVLNASDAARTGVGTSASNVRVETAAGSSSMQRARIDNISVAGQSMKGVAAVVMRDNLKVSLLGQSALAQLGSVSLKRGELTLN
jgi:aspartyl protease family protein